MIRVKISNNDGEFVFKNVNFIRIDGEDFIINYQDDNDENHEEIGPVPGDVIVEDYIKLLTDLENLLIQATKSIYGEEDYKKANLVYNSIRRYTKIKSIDDLLEYDAYKIADIRNVGVTSYDIIMKARCLAKEERRNEIHI